MHFRAFQIYPLEKKDKSKIKNYKKQPQNNHDAEISQNKITKVCNISL